MRNLLSKPVTGYNLLVHLMVVFGLVLAGLLVSLHGITASERQFCGLVATQLDAYREAPPTTDTGKALKKRYEALQRSLSCEEVK